MTKGYAQEDPELIELTIKALHKLAPMNLAYVHFSENITNYIEVPESFRQEVRRIYPNPIVMANKLNFVWWR